jgi:hypothetical protein
VVLNLLTRSLLVARTIPQGRESRLWCILVCEAVEAGTPLSAAMSGARRLVEDQATPPTHIYLWGASEGPAAARAHRAAAFNGRAVNQGSDVGGTTRRR